MSSEVKPTRDRSINISKLRQLFELLKEFGVTNYDNGELKLTLDPHVQQVKEYQIPNSPDSIVYPSQVDEDIEFMHSAAD